MRQLIREYLESVLFGDGQIPEEEQCIQPGCTNRQHIMEQCKKCNEFGWKIADARAKVRVGKATMAFERRCFDCGGVEVDTVTPSEQRPDSRCSECGGDNTNLTTITGGDLDGIPTTQR